jgi:hypothetical protein
LLVAAEFSVNRLCHKPRRAQLEVKRTRIRGDGKISIIASQGSFRFLSSKLPQREGCFSNRIPPLIRHRSCDRRRLVIRFIAPRLGLARGGRNKSQGKDRQKETLFQGSLPRVKQRQARTPSVLEDSGVRRRTQHKLEKVPFSLRFQSEGEDFRADLPQRRKVGYGRPTDTPAHSCVNGVRSIT